jgi:hypothetical protein
MEITPDIAKQAKEEIEAICTKYGISLVPVVVHQGNRTFSSIEIVPAQTQAFDSEPAVIPAAE